MTWVYSRDATLPHAAGSYGTNACREFFIPFSSRGSVTAIKEVVDLRSGSEERQRLVKKLTFGTYRLHRCSSSEGAFRWDGWRDGSSVPGRGRLLLQDTGGALIVERDCVRFRPSRNPERAVHLYIRVATLIWNKRTPRIRDTHRNGELVG